MKISYSECLEQITSGDASAAANHTTATLETAKTIQLPTEDGGRRGRMNSRREKLVTGIDDELFRPSETTRHANERTNERTNGRGLSFSEVRT